LIALYIVAAACGGYIFLDTIKLFSPRAYNIPLPLALMSSFVFGVAAHYLLTH